MKVHERVLVPGAC